MPRLAEIQTERLRLCLPEPSGAPAVLAYFVDNRAHLEPWEPVRPSDFYTLAFWERRLAESRAEAEAGQSLRFFLRLRGGAEEPVVGSANFTNIVRGAFRACYLGYGLDRRHEGQGLMSEALRAAIPEVFLRLDLHRVMANYQPDNERSGRLLARLGFEREGYAKDYLMIDGAWRDHVLTALVRPEGA